MAYQITYQQPGNVQFLAYHGEITAQEESDAFVESLTRAGLEANGRILVDRTHGKMLSSPVSVREHVALVKQLSQGLGRLMVAMVAPRDFDFAMSRMFEMSSAGKLDHQLKVFREMHLACEWLGVEPPAIDSVAER